uniref:Phosphoinositide phospholipase C n=1 Tax=Esox lucius TaxID=8010 RepID=A0A3P8XM60_ESOLU
SSAMKKTKVSPSRRVYIQNIYRCYTSEGSTMPASALLRFLHIEQMEKAASQETAEGLIDRYEIDQTGERMSRTMTFDGFYRYMESKDCHVFDQTHASVYQDMEQPLCHYYISSSHNTYLTGNQLVGRSTQDSYVSALRRACRCLEIDCWDGPGGEPIVYHGHTLTSKIFFKDIILSIEQHAFEVSPYPVILSLENHCTHGQQEVIAQHLISILGDKLLVSGLVHNTQPGQLPSPEDKAVVVAEKLSNLVVYTKSVKFHNFAHSREHQRYFENTSLGEKKARKLAKASALEFLQHNMMFITRIYPAGSRTLSSNYNPQEFWNVGSQLVALNFQSLGLPMDLNNGLFQDNGGCGYVLKPNFLRMDLGVFNPNSYRYNLKPAHLLLKVVSGSNLPASRSGKALDPFIRLEIHGPNSDCTSRDTDTVRRNSLNPHWDTAMNFTISVPDLCLIRFSARYQTGLTSEFIGQYTLPLISMKKGKGRAEVKE